MRERRARYRASRDRLGVLTRTNSEALAGAEVKLRHRKQYDFTQGVAITSSFHPDEFTHIEPVRYGKGSNAMALLATVMTRRRRTDPALAQVARRRSSATPASFSRTSPGIAHWSERTTIALVMQTHDNSLTLYPSRGLFGRFKLALEAGPRAARTRPGSPPPTRPAGASPSTSTASRSAASATSSTSR